MRVTVINQKTGQEVKAQLEISNDRELVIWHDDPAPEFGSQVVRSISLRVIKAYLTDRKNLVLIVAE